VSRHGYTEDDHDDAAAQWSMIRWQGALKSAIRGKAGQRFLRELRDALDALPEQALCRGVLATSTGEVCALGAVAKRRKLDVTEFIDEDGLDPEDFGALLGIPDSLAREIMYQNDEWCDAWKHVRTWVDARIVYGPENKP
jgi:hypothetical protein